MKNNTPATNSPVRKTSPFRYGFGMLGTSIPINMLKSYAAAYYVLKLGLITTSQFADILFIYTFVDAIDNPIYGLLSDRTNTKWGKRRPWLVIGTPLLILSFVVFFNMPATVQSNKGQAYMYILLMYILTGTLDSLMNASYGALFPTLFKTDEERAKTNAVRQVCQLVAMVISIVLTPIVTEKIGYGLTALIYGIIALIVIMYMTFGCHEDIAAENAELEAQGEKPGLFRAIFDLVTNSKFWMFGLANALYSAAFSLISQALPFYVKYSLKLENSMTTVLLGVVFAVALIGIVVWSNVIKKVKIMNVWRAGFIVMAVGFVPLYFATNLVSALIITCIMGFGVSGCLITMDCIAAKIIDDDYDRHGIKREGMLTSLIGVLNRLNGLYVSLGFKIVYSVYGFVDGNDPGSNPDSAARFLLCLFPFIAMAIATVFTMFVNFDKKKKVNAASSDAAETVACDE